MTRLPDFTFPETDLSNPPCPYFEECGSCQLQHIKREKYQFWKEQQVRDLIAANGLTPKEWLSAIFVGEGTRRRVAFTVQRDTDKITLGFNKYHSHDIVEISSCLILTPRLERLVGQLPVVMEGIVHKGTSLDVMVQETDGDLLDCVITGLIETGSKQTGQIARLAEICNFARISFRKDTFATPVPQISMTALRKTSGAISVEVPAGAFLQPSKEGEAALVGAVMSALAPRKLGRKDKIADMFSGCGTFAGHMLERYSVHAIEGDSGMADSLSEAAKGNARLSAEWRDLFKEPVSARELRDYSAVVFDPPRSGAKEQCQKLAKSSVPLIIGVSCNPATFARDAKILTAGGYKFKSAQMVDQFTWSTHSEIVGVFEKE